MEMLLFPTGKKEELADITAEDLLNSLSYMVPNQLPASAIALAKVTGKMTGWTGYKHDQVDNNATARIKAALVGPSLTLTIHEGKPVLGTWQQIFLAEFDGPRSQRRVLVQVVGR